MKAVMAMKNTRPSALDDALYALERQFGLEFPPYRMDEFNYKLKMASAETGYKDPEHFLEDLARSSLTSAKTDALLRHITVNESYFFRHHEQLDALAEFVLPSLDSNIDKDNDNIRIWSAGCAQGEEPYSLAIKFREHAPILNHAIKIIGTDINHSAISQASKGQYKSWSLRDLPQWVIDRYFSQENEKYYLIDRIKNKARFKKHNLASHIQQQPFGPKSVHLIACRNVLIYMSPKHVTWILKRFIQALAPGGYLLLGPSENIQATRVGFKTVHLKNTVIYQKPLSNEKCVMRRKIYHDPDKSNGLAKQKKNADHDRINFQAVEKKDLASAMSRADQLVDQGNFNKALQGLEPYKGHLEAELKKTSIQFAYSDPKSIRLQCEYLRENYPGHVAGYYYLALLSYREGDLERSLAWLKQALYLDHKFIAAHLQAAMVLFRQSKHLESASAWRNAENLLCKMQPDQEVPFADGRKASDLLQLIKEAKGETDGSG